MPALPIRGSWQIDTPNRRLVVALALSLVTHGLLFALWHASPALAAFARKTVDQILPSRQQRTEIANQRSPQPPTAPREVPLVFVEVDPATAAAEPPKASKFYSTHNTVAANPEPVKQSDQPKIDGSQARMMRLMDNPRPQPQPLQPTPPPEPLAEANPKPPAPPEPPAPKRSEPPGDMALARVETKADPVEAAPKEPDPPAPHRRPRTLREAMQRNPALAGQKTQQDGGVPRRARIAMVDAKGSPFGDYDYQFIKAVEQRWYHLLDNNQYMLDRQGKVVLDFRLHFDGRVTKMHVADSTVGEILSLICQRAILDPAPFPRWPAEMRRLVKEEYREVRFTFYYD